MPTNYHLSDAEIVEGIEMTKSLICWGNNGQSFTQESKITSKSVKEMNNVFGQSGQKITLSSFIIGQNTPSKRLTLAINNRF